MSVAETPAHPELLDRWLTRGAIAVIVTLQFSLINDFGYGTRRIAPIVEIILLIPLTALMIRTERIASRARNRKEWESSSYRSVSVVLGIALVIVVSLQCLYTFSSFQAQKRLVLDHDRQLASQIYQRIVAEIPDFDRTKTYPIDFYGAHEFRTRYKEIGDSTWSASFFEWDGGNPDRIVKFMIILGYSNFAQIGDATRAALLPAEKIMPIWPARGSVQVVDGTVLVRLGKEPGKVHEALEHPAP